jgi:hypothetical protein
MGRRYIPWWVVALALVNVPLLAALIALEVL